MASASQALTISHPSVSLVYVTRWPLEPFAFATPAHYKQSFLLLSLSSRLGNSRQLLYPSEISQFGINVDVNRLHLQLSVSIFLCIGACVMIC